jgi:hypothetical protein
MSFRITGLPAENFDHLFAMSDDELGAQGAVRRKADGPAMRFAIFVRKGEETYDRIDEVPQQLRTRTLAARAFDADGMMVAFELVEGAKLEVTIERLLAKPRAAYLHIHFAAPGCYAARVERA